MIWANFLHLYQPADQQPDILEAVVSQSYRPLIQGLQKSDKVRLTMNITGALFEVFDKYGYHDLIQGIREVYEQGRLELTGSAKFHAFLPMLSDDEIKRQVTANTETLRKYLGESFNPKGFFPPEMGYDPKLVPILEELGYEWVVIDEIAYSGGTDPVDYTKIYKIANSNLYVYFRDRRYSNLIMSAVVRTYDSLVGAVDLSDGHYVLTGMDGETFGHHRPGLENLLFEVFDGPEFELIQISDIKERFNSVVEITPIKSTWASSKQDIENGIQFLSWNDPSNKIHKWQWELRDLVLDGVYSMGKSHPEYEKVRNSMDKALASDHFWWASAKPWWSVEMIEDGAHMLLQTYQMIPNYDKDKMGQIYTLYQNIVSTAFEWQRTGKIRQMAREQHEIQRIPFKERTLDAGGREVGIYHAFIDMMKGLEKKAAEKGEYEQAILWRDSVYKIENKQDIYDAINAIDLLRTEIPHEEVEKTLDKYTEKYKEIRGGQPEQRGA